MIAGCLQPSPKNHNSTSEAASVHLVMLFFHCCCYGAELQVQVFVFLFFLNNSEIGCILS